MRTVVVTPPAPLVTWAEADVHLNLDGDTSQQAYVETLIAAATSWIDGPGGWLGRAIGEQTLEARASSFCGPLRLMGPVLEVTSITYVNSDGSETTLEDAVYELAGDEIVLGYGESWPALRGDREGVRVRYQAGYETVPPAIKAAILLMVGHLYAHREAVSDAKPETLPLGVESLLAPYRVWRL